MTPKFQKPSDKSRNSEIAATDKPDPDDVWMDALIRAMERLPKLPETPADMSILDDPPEDDESESG